MSPTNHPPEPEITESMYDALSRFDELVDALVEAEKLSNNIAVSVARETPAGKTLWAHSAPARRERENAQRDATRAAKGARETQDKANDVLVRRNAERAERREAAGR